MTKISPYIAGRIREASLRSTKASIARRFRVSHTTISRVLSGEIPTGVRRPRRMAAALRARRTLVDSLASRIAVRGNARFPVYESAPAIHKELQRRGYTVSLRSVQRDLVAEGYKSYVLKFVPTREPEVHQSRLKFSTVTVKKGSSYMRRLKFSDEHQTTRNDHSNRLQWAKNVEDICTREKKRVQNTDRVQVWGCIGLGYKSHLVLLKKPKRGREDEGQEDKRRGFRQTSSTYIRKCLARMNLPPNSVFMQDGASCHTAGATLEYLRRKNVEVLPGWPPYSPDLNPIEDVWAELNRRVSLKHPKDAQELEAFTLQAWSEIPQSTIDSYVLSFEGRLRECIRKRGRG